MSEVVYKPPIDYKASIFTPPSKTPILSAFLLSGTKRILSAHHTRGTAGTTSSVVYQVPAGKIFFITNITLELYHVTQTVTAELYVNLSELLCYMSESLPYTVTASQQWNFQVPLRLNEAEFLTFTETVGGVSATQVTALIVGYELDSTQIPYLI